MGNQLRGVHRAWASGKMARDTGFWLLPSSLHHHISELRVATCRLALELDALWSLPTLLSVRVHPCFLLSPDHSGYGPITFASFFPKSPTGLNLVQGSTYVAPSPTKRRIRLGSRTELHGQSRTTGFIGCISLPWHLKDVVIRPYSCPRHVYAQRAKPGFRSSFPFKGPLQNHLEGPPSKLKKSESCLKIMSPLSLSFLFFF